ncbi:alternative cyclin Pcl12 [Coprinopsis sp. MPI-PUGE-AT-0042]|nr:alternative cyclin Pcl12 [Coprinopsis sp. MPI-PUGE-AT-0042]
MVADVVRFPAIIVGSRRGCVGSQILYLPNGAESGAKKNSILKCPNLGINTHPATSLCPPLVYYPSTLSMSLTNTTTQTGGHMQNTGDYRKGPSAAPRMRSNQSVPNAAAPNTTSSRPDPFYGHEPMARMCARFITHLFACPEYPPTTTHAQAKLPHFVAYALHRTKLHPSVTFASLILLQRLKARFPTARGSSGHRLFISAFMIASKVICDDTYSNKSWGIVAQGMFSLREINQMEREMCSYLDWELTVDGPMLGSFETAVRADFAQDKKTYPSYPLTAVSKRVSKSVTSPSAAPTPEPDSTNAIPNFGQHRHASPSRSTSNSPVKSSRSSPAGTPSPSYSTSTSPASSVSPQTPVGPENNTVRIHGIDDAPFTVVEDAPPVHPLKGQMFAFALPSKW